MHGARPGQIERSTDGNILRSIVRYPAATSSNRWENERCDTTQKTFGMFRFEQIWDKRHRTSVLLLSGTMILILAVVDWWTKSYISLGFLYLFPIMLSAGILPRWALVLLGIGCAGLSELFSSLNPEGGYIRLAFEALALAGSGLVVAEMSRNRRLSLEAQESLRILVETSPAAIVTIDDRGFIELANRAATELMARRASNLIGHPIAAYLPELHHALRREEGPQFRTSMQCRGHRDDGETFTADVWFSTYIADSRPKLRRLSRTSAMTRRQYPMVLALTTGTRLR